MLSQAASAVLINIAGKLPLPATIWASVTGGPACVFFKGKADVFHFWHQTRVRGVGVSNQKGYLHEFDEAAFLLSLYVLYFIVLILVKYKYKRVQKKKGKLINPD
jgi:hypothetical protein